MDQYDSLWTHNLLEQFHQFDDALVREVRLVIGPSRNNCRATIALEAREINAEHDEGWRKVILNVRGLTEYRLVENDRVSCYVLSLGLKFHIFDGIYYFDLGGDTDEPDCLDDFRRSQFYLAGRNCSWEVRPYPKSWMRRTREKRTARG